MNHWYDKDAMVRKLKPSEKIIVLLLNVLLSDCILATVINYLCVFVLHCFNKCDGIVISKNHDWMKCT
jgi:hypothetical protein